jgi:uncharacterized membrane protein YfcA
MDTLLLSLLIFLAAMLYSSVGHAGASGYLSAMALMGLAPSVMKPAALVLNVLVAFIASVRFYRAGFFDWNKFWPFALTSVPCAFLGGLFTLPSSVYKQLLGLILLFAAYRLFRYTQRATASIIVPLPVPIAMGFGALIGFLAGLTGVGGGIFLSPLLLLMSWADTRQTAGVSALFILVNSLSGLAGQWVSVPQLPTEIYFWGIAAVAGGLIGSEFGSHRFASWTLRRILALVLVIAGLKLILV